MRWEGTRGCQKEMTEGGRDGGRDEGGRDGGRDGATEGGKKREGIT